MALRLRRGTDAQRLLITPAEGELIYTTDTKSLYVGDGSTVGGLIINSAENLQLGELNDVDLITNPPATNQVLKWDGTNWVPADDIGSDLVNNIIQSGQDFRINIIADDSTRMVDVANNTLTGKLYGDIWDIDTDEKVVEANQRFARLDIRTDNDTVIFEHNTANLYDNSGNLLIDGTLRAFVGDVDGNMRGSVYNADLSVAILNHLTGELTGDLKGSVFGDDSSVIVDAVNGTLNGELISDRITPTQSQFTIERDSGVTEVHISSVETRSRFNLVATSNTTDLSTYTGYYGTMNFGYHGTEGASPSYLGSIRGSDSDVRLTHDVNGGLLSDETKYLTIKDGDVGIGTYTPQAKLDVRGAIMPGVYADATARDAAIPTPVAGMMVYVTDVAKHQGYNGAGWQDLY
jgi:hypothetical protein